MTEDIDREDLRRAARVLMGRPLLRSGGSDAALAAIVRKPQHQRVLQQWFERNFGWNLIVDRDVVRLQKIPAMEAAHPEDAPSQRVCVLYCLVLAALEDCGEQTVITEIAQKIIDLSLTRPNLVTYDPGSYAERRALVKAIRLLGTHRVLVPTRGEAATEDDETEYIHSNGNAIYDVQHRVAAVLLSSPVPPSRAGATPGGLTQELFADTVDGRNRRRRHQIMRRLADEPVMHFDELDEDTLAYFKNQRPLLVSELTDMIGGQVEVRAEGAALVDDELSDIRFPYHQTSQYAALLMAERLAEQPVATGQPVSNEVLMGLAAEVAIEVAARVKTIGGRDVNVANVLETALKVLSGLRLVHLLPDGVIVRPALGRFRKSAQAGIPRGSGTGPAPLFEEGPQ